jgi:ferredoxin
MKIVVDRSRCTGLGMCESLAPDVFEVGDDGHLVVLSEEIELSRLGELETAAAACPTEALRIVRN